MSSGFTPFWRQFQLTRPVWGEPNRHRNPFSNNRNFNSLAPCGANLAAPVYEFSLAGFSRSCSGGGPPVRFHAFSSPPYDFNSLAPCGANRRHTQSIEIIARFQLTRPVWGEPCCYCSSATSSKISTHSPRVGRTDPGDCGHEPSSYFNSLAPCGANQSDFVPQNGRCAFQLTRPVWGEPGHNSGEIGLVSISTHSPRVGRTRRAWDAPRISAYFNSLAPCGANRIRQTN